MRAGRTTIAAAATIAVFAFAAPLARAAHSSAATAHESSVAPGRVLVAARPGVDPRSLEASATGRAPRVVPGRPDLVVVETTPGDEAATAARLRGRPGVAWAAPDGIAHIAAVPSDPYFAVQWNLRDRSVAGSADWAPIWGTGITGAGVTVAVVDTGVTPNPELLHVLPGYNFVGNNTNTSDPNGHGTHIAGTIAQATDNAVGVAGVASGASILPVRALDSAGAGTYDTIIAGIEYAVAHGARVINLSFGGDNDGGLCDELARATSAGVTVVVAAGNSNGAVAYPAACPAAIGVSATTLTGAPASYSNHGPQIALAAPGGDNTVDLNGDGHPDGILQYTFSNGVGGYYFLSGTSMASPHVAGAAALLLQAAPGITPAQVRAVLMATATDLGTPGPDDRYGAGLLDIAKAVTTAASENLPSVPPATTSSTGAPGVTRLAGASRYATAAAVSQAGWSNGSTIVYLASGTAFPDALATGALAGREPGPLLLTAPCSLPGETAAELSRLRPLTVTIVGGAAAVCDTVAGQVGQITGATVQQLAGADRYATSVALSRAGWVTADTVYLAGGTAFPDGLAGGALASHGAGPLLLTAPCALPGAVRDELVRLRTTHVEVLGGTGAVCDAVVQAAASATGAIVTRVAGTDRYGTAASAAAAGWPSSTTYVYVASGLTFPDGLSSGPLAGLTGAPLLLVPTCSLPATVAAALQQLHPLHVEVVGGTAAVCDAVLSRLAAASAATA